MVGCGDFHADGSIPSAFAGSRIFVLLARLTISNRASAFISRTVEAAQHFVEQIPGTDCTDVAEDERLWRRALMAKRLRSAQVGMTVIGGTFPAGE